MSNKIYGRKLGRGQGARRALFRALVRAMVAQGSITTTKAKAKTYQKAIDKLVTTAKKDTLASRRMISSKLGGDRGVVEGLIKKVLPSLKKVNSGYTTRVNLQKRKGDNAEMVRLQWNRMSVASEKSKSASKKSEEKSVNKSQARKVLNKLKPQKKSVKSKK